MNESVANNDFPYQDLINNTCVISCVLNRDAKILDANKQFYKTLGINEFDDDSKTFKFYLEHSQIWSSYLKKLDTNKDFITETIKLFNPDGTLVYLKSNLGTREGKIYMVSVDVTEDILNTQFASHVNHLAKLGGWTYNPELDEAHWTKTIFEILDIQDHFQVHRDSILEYIHPGYVDYFKQIVLQFYKNKEQYDITLKVITHLKREKWIRITAYPEIRNQKVVFVQGTLQDISTQKYQSIALEETKINMELALRAMNSGYFMHNLLNDEVIYSSSFRDKMNLPTTLKEKEFRNFIHPEDRDEAYLQHERELRSESAYYINAYRLMSQNGNFKHFEVYGFKTFDADGKPVKLVGNLIDVEDKYRLTHMQDRHRYHLKTLLDNAFVRSIMIDSSWNLIGMDAKTLKLFKNKLGHNPVSRKDSFKDLLSSHDLLKFQIIDRVISTGREYRKEIFLEMFEDDRTYYDALFKPILNYSNQVDGYVFYFFDLTDQAKTQQELRSVQDQLRSVYQFKNEMINKIGHEIKTPLHSLLQTTQLLLQKGTYDLREDSELLKAQQESANQLLNSFDNIINSAVYTDELYNITEIIDLQKVLAQIYKGAKKRATSSNLDLEFENFIEPATVRADSVFLKQALENLIDNAFKFTKEGYIKVDTLVTERYAIISLIDTGAGIPITRINKMFEPFEQVRTRGFTKSLEGLGLGLTFAIKYIEGIGGKLNVQSVIGKGTTFTLALPLRQ